MMKWLEKINQLSLPTVLFIASSLTVVSVLPLWLYASTQATRTSTRAVGTLNTPTPTQPAPTEGPIPTQAPVISRVYPWVGKPGDSIVIEGTHFGTYPHNRRLAIGDVLLPDTHVTSWSDTQIEAIIPQQPKQGGTVQLRIDTYPVTESLPLTFFDASARLKLRKNDRVIRLEGAKEPLQATLWTSSGKREVPIPLQSDQTPVFTLAENEAILSVLITNAQGQAMAYSFNPSEFGY